TIAAWIQYAPRWSELHGSASLMQHSLVDSFGSQLGAVRRQAGVATAPAELKVLSLFLFSQVSQFAYFREILGWDVDEDAGIHLLADLWRNAMLSEPAGQVE